MVYHQSNNPFKKLMSNIGSKLNIQSPGMSDPVRGASGQRAYQKAQLKRPGHQKESKFQYDVRMRKEGSRAKKTMHDPDKDKIPTGVDATPWGNIPEEQQTVSTNPNDLRKKWNVHISDQTYRGGEAFEFPGEPGDKFRYRKVGRDLDDINIFEFMDPDRPGEWIPAQSVDGDYTGLNAITDLYTKYFQQTYK